MWLWLPTDKRNSLCTINYTMNVRLIDQFSWLSFFSRRRGRLMTWLQVLADINFFAVPCMMLLKPAMLSLSKTCCNQPEKMMLPLWRCKFTAVCLRTPWPTKICCSNRNIGHAYHHKDYTMQIPWEKLPYFQRSNGWDLWMWMRCHYWHNWLPIWWMVVWFRYR